MTYFLFISSGNHVQFDPDKDFERKDRLIVNDHRTRGAKLYRYKFGAYKKWDVPLSFLTSGDAAIINSWWETNSKVLFMKSGASEVFSVFIVNDNLPMGKHVEPYDDLYLGVIELECY